MQSSDALRVNPFHHIRKSFRTYAITIAPPAREGALSPVSCPAGRRHRWRTDVIARASLLCALLIVSAAFVHATRPTAPSRAAKQTQAKLEQTNRARAAALAAQQHAAARAAALAAAAAQLAAQRSDAETRLREAEQATDDAASRLEALAAARRQAAEDLAEQAKAIEPLLPLMERLSLYPTETLLAVTLQPQDAVRGLLVLQGMAQQVAVEAASLRREQAALSVASQAVAAQAPLLATAEAAQAAAAAALDRQLARTDQSRLQAEGQEQAAASRAADLAARAASLQALLDRLGQVRRDGEARARADAARAARENRPGALAEARRREVAFAIPPNPLPQVTAGPGPQFLTPVVGRVVRGWGDATDAGPAAGLSYRAAPAARVVAPCSGRVMFAAPFRSYGKLLIIDCGGGYDAVLAGFERLDAQPGAALRSGDPVGVMPAWNPAGGQHPPSLYVELRRDGEPVDPTPWLRPSS